MRKKKIRSISIEEEVDELMKKYSFVNWSIITNSLLKNYLEKHKELLEKIVVIDEEAKLILYAS